MVKSLMWKPVSVADGNAMGAFFGLISSFIHVI